MNNKFIISLSMLIALTGASCRGAAESNEQMAQRLHSEELAGLTVPVAPQGAETPSDFSKMPVDVIVNHMLPYLSAADLMNLAGVRPDVYPFIKEISRFKLLQQHLNREMQKHNGNKQEVFFEATRGRYPGAIDVVDYLAPYVDINAQNNYGQTALIAAVNPAMAELLLAKGASINMQDKWSYTALMWAVMLDMPALVELLLSKGADINAQSKEGSTALSMANQKLTDNPGDQDYQNRARTIIDLLKKVGR